MIKPVARFVALSFFLQSIIPTGLAAPLKLQAPDIEPPEIEFDVGSTDISDGVKVFSARVTDNIGVATVTLYYKEANDVVFKSKAMEKFAQDFYSTELTVDSAISNKLEFYIRADDVSGNSIFEGQQFSPFVYTVVPAAVAESPTQTAAASEDEEEGMSTMTMILIGLGVAALAGGGGGGGGGNGDDTGTLTITTELPD